jgi:uncharacterized protein YkuJ
MCTGKYELFIRGGKMISEGDYSEENRFADFSFWVSDNSVKCDTKFHQIDNVSIEIMLLLSCCCYDYFLMVEVVIVVFMCSQQCSLR